MGLFERREIGSAPWRAKESFLSPVKTGSHIHAICGPTPEGVGYGSYRGYTAIGQLECGDGAFSETGTK
jgi:hypothetical protein